jgi:lipopolysaccharide transport system permease protein
MSNIVVYGPASPLRDPAAFMRSLIRDLMVSRELAWRLFVRDVNAQYRQSLLGYIWFFVPPIIAALPFIFLESQGIVNVTETPVSYAAYAMVSTTIWQSFVDAINAPLRAVAAAKPMLTKVNLPREAVLLSAFYQVLFGVAIRVVTIAAVMVWFGIMPAATTPLAFVGIMALLLLGFMVGLLLTPIGLLYGDIASMMPAITTFLMVVTPVLYPVPKSGLAAQVAYWNPLVPMVSSTRDWLFIGHTIYGPALFVTLAITLVFLFVGWVSFRVAVPHLVARMGN